MSEETNVRDASSSPGDTCMDASVIVPTYGRPDYCRHALQTLLAQDFPTEKYEIIVVDNLGSHEVADFVDQARKTNLVSIRYVIEETPGLHNARHAGAGSAVGEVLVFVDDDISAPPGWLGAILAPFRNEKVAVVGGKVEPRFEGPVPDWMRNCPSSYLSLLDLGDKRRELTWPESAYGCNMAVRRSILYEAGGFHPDAMGDRKDIWQRGDGETGLQKKIYDMGHKVVYDPEAWLYHRIPETRLKIGYFRWRSFIQGISDSYTLARQSRTSKAMFRHAFGCFRRALRDFLLSIADPRGKMEINLRMWYWYGRAQHQLRTGLSKELRRHVALKTYLINDDSRRSRTP